MTRQIRLRVRGRWHTVEVEDPQRYPFQVMVDGEPLEIEVEPGDVSSTVGKPTAPEATGAVGLAAITEEDRKIIRSPMPGRIIAVSVKVWDQVTPGTEVCILEAMKMEQSVRISQRGTIRAVFIKPGQSVAVGDPLVQLE